MASEWRNASPQETQSATRSLDARTVLACGDGAVLSFRSAADAHGVLPYDGARFDVTGPGAAGRKLEGIRVHRARLDPRDISELHGIPITSVPRTYLDLAATVNRSLLDRALERGEELQLFDLRAIEELLDRARGHRGVARLRDAIAVLQPEPEVTRSKLERFAVALVRRHGLPRPAVNAWIHGNERDLAWPGHRVVVGIDTYRHHGGPHAFERDRARDAGLAVHGYRVIRFTGRQLEHEADRCAAILRAVLRPALAP